MSNYYQKWLRDNVIYKEYIRNVPLAKLAIQFSLSEKTIRNIIVNVSRTLKHFTAKESELNIDEIHRQYIAGESIKALCYKYKATPDVIVSALEKRNVKFATPILNSYLMRTVSESQIKAIERKQKVADLFSKGYSKKEIADFFGVTERTIETDLNEMNIYPNKSGFKLATVKRVDAARHLFMSKFGRFNPIDFVRNPAFLNFSPFFMQQLILKIFYGVPLDANEQTRAEKLVKEGRLTWDGVNRKHKELILIAGMRGSKTTLASLIGCIEEYDLYSKHITCGSISKYYGFPEDQRIFILIVATNETQSIDTCMSAIRSRIHNSEYYKSREASIKELDTDFIFYDTNVVIRAGHSNSASLAGKTSKAVIIEELSRFRDAFTGARSSRPVYETVTRGTASFGDDGKIVVITSPLDSKDFCFELFDLSKEIDNMVGFILPTWEMNDNIKRYKSECKRSNQVHLETEFKKNPETASRDYGCVCFRPIEAYFRKQDKLKECFYKTDFPVMDDGKFANWFVPKPGCSYFVHCDPAVKNDRFAIAMSHPENGMIVNDLIYHFEAVRGTEIDQESVLQFLEDLLDLFKVEIISFDTWAASAIKQQLEKRGGVIKNLVLTKVHYDILKSYIYDNRLISFKHDLLLDELFNLTVVDSKKVDHVKNSSKDLADALAGSVYHCHVHLEADKETTFVFGEDRKLMMSDRNIVSELYSPISGNRADRYYVPDLPLPF